MKYSFIKISDLQMTEPNLIVDILGLMRWWMMVEMVEMLVDGEMER